MDGTGWTEVMALLAAFGIAVTATPAGISGAVLLLPFQVSVLGTGRPAADVAPAALTSTFATSLAGVATFTLLSARYHGPVAPDWPTGIALGLGGLAGAYAIGARYLWSGLS